MNKIYSEISPLDPDKILQNEWLNSRGAIARFDRNTIEIRIMDSQEAPLAEIAIVELISKALKKLINGSWSTVQEQQNLNDDLLHEIFLRTIKTGEDSIITEKEYLTPFGINKKIITAGDIWKHLFDSLIFESNPEQKSILNPVEIILYHGTLAKRILKSLKGDASKDNLISIYRTLSGCLKENKMFIP